MIIIVGVEKKQSFLILPELGFFFLFTFSNLTIFSIDSWCPLHSDLCPRQFGSFPANTLSDFCFLGARFSPILSLVGFFGRQTGICVRLSVGAL